MFKIPRIFLDFLLSFIVAQKEVDFNGIRLDCILGWKNELE